MEGGSGRRKAPEPSPGEAEPPRIPIPTARLLPKLAQSAKLFADGRRRIPNASSSVVRVAAYDPVPPFLARGEGARVWDEDGNGYLDFNLAYGVLIHGHAPPEQVEAIRTTAAFGLHFASPTALEIEVARQFQRMVPTAERVVFCSNGSDATSSALRIARAVTGREGVLRFEGHYHGQHDLARMGPEPLSPEAGPDPVVPFNSVPAFEEAVRRFRGRLGAVILEPVMANAGVIPPEAGFLDRVVELAHANGLLVVFDEVLTGFRVAPGGAQQLYRVEPDLSCWAKALGGGVPIAAVSGKAACLDAITLGWTRFGGTYFANNLSLAGTLANLAQLQRGGTPLYARLAQLTERLARGLEEAARDAGLGVLVQRVPGLLQFYFTSQPRVTNYREAARADGNLYLRHQQLLLDRGIYIHPDPLERISLSTAHTEQDVGRFVSVARETLRELASLPRDGPPPPAPAAPPSSP